MITLLIGFSAVNTGNNLLFLVVAGLLAFMSVTGLAGMYNIKKLIPNLHPPEEIYAGTPALFHLSVNNMKRYIPSFLIRVESQTGENLVFSVLQKNSTADGTLLLTFNKRGKVPSGRITISSPYPVGFFTRYWCFEIDSSQIVFPRLIASNSNGGSREESSAAGSGLRRERGMNGELERIFPYSGSEPLRLIHWKHSARSNDLLVKGFGRRVVAPLLIEVDSLAGHEVEERLSRAAWLIKRWVRERPVGLLLGGRVFAAEMGKQHGIQLLKELALYDCN